MHILLLIFRLHKKKHTCTVLYVVAVAYTYIDTRFDIHAFVDLDVHRIIVECASLRLYCDI